MEIERILNNDIGVLMSRSNEGKTHTLCSLIQEYKQKYNGSVTTFGFKDALINLLDVQSFSSLIELEEIRNSVIIVDEVGILFDLENRKKRRMIEGTLRLVNHRGNKILLSGLPSDFKKFLCAKSKVFLFKTLMISDLINGSLAKEMLLQYRGLGLGAHSLLLPKEMMLCFDGRFWTERMPYNAAYDTKLENENLFKKSTEKSAKNVH
ncbi:MAG: hypothetical protein KAX49_14080 [Halanaerobiales bacterium]|nr:hypothetical protein [Halanaerobiales bacterium]